MYDRLLTNTDSIKELSRTKKQTKKAQQFISVVDLEYRTRQNEYEKVKEERYETSNSKPVDDC